MKKLTFALITMLLLAPSFFASQKTKTFIFLGAYSAKVMEQDATLYSIGYGWSRTFESDLYAGGVFAFNYGKTQRDTLTQEQATLTSYDVDLRLGYSFERVDIFGIGAAVMQSLDNVAGYGFGYGAGATWQINERWSLGTEYKIHSMTPENSLADYDYELFTTRIGYSW